MDQANGARGATKKSETAASGSNRLAEMLHLSTRSYELSYCADNVRMGVGRTICAERCSRSPPASCTLPGTDALDGHITKTLSRSSSRSHRPFASIAAHSLVPHSPHGRLGTKDAPPPTESSRHLMKTPPGSIRRPSTNIALRTTVVSRQHAGQCHSSNRPPPLSRDGDVSKRVSVEAPLVCMPSSQTRSPIPFRCRGLFCPSSDARTGWEQNSTAPLLLFLDEHVLFCGFESIFLL